METVIRRKQELVFLITILPRKDGKQAGKTKSFTVYGAKSIDEICKILVDAINKHE